MGEKEHINHESKQMEQDQESSKDEKMRHGTTLSAVEDETKKDDDTIVLKVYMHCEACAKKVARSLKGFPGVEDVMANSEEGIVRVKGKGADPVKVYERVQAKSKRHVDLISPLPQPIPPTSDEKVEQNNEPPAATTTVLNVQMHCEACARVIRKELLKIKGVEFATTDVSNNQAVVTGTIKPSELVKQLYKKTKKIAAIVPPPPPPEEGQNKAGEEKKDVENADTSHEGEGKDKQEEDKQEDVKRNQIWPTRHYTDYVRSYVYPPPPHIFSDENPNACCVM
uniref:HMA domain-containing protein n=1 Tax=Kalanchoe fedtschenkoi TaxID=63787 RepID=A0A7N1A3K9_KALFE